MKISVFTKIISIVSIVGIILGATSVYANWQYANSPPETKSQEFAFEIDEYISWEGSEDLPTHTEGENHAALITDLVFGTASGNYENGLNNSNSAINEYVEDRKGSWISGWSYDYFGSMAVTGGDEMTKLFGADTKGLNFIIQKKSDTSMFIYTTSVFLGTAGEVNWLSQRTKNGVPSIPLGEYISPVYRTELTRSNKNSDWNIVASLIGKAKSDWYDESRRDENLTQIPSFDITTWVESNTLGATMTTDDAIWTFDGDNPTTFVEAKTTPTYYRMTPKTAGTRVITADNEDAKIRIYDANGALITDDVTVSDGKAEASFVASANTLYYISILGDYQITITITAI